MAKGWIGTPRGNPYISVTPYEVEILVDEGHLGTALVQLWPPHAELNLKSSEELEEFIFRVPRGYVMSSAQDNFPPPDPPKIRIQRDSFVKVYEIIETRRWDRILIDIPVVDLGAAPLTHKELRSMIGSFWERNNHHPDTIVLGTLAFKDFNTDFGDDDLDFHPWMRRKFSDTEHAMFGFMGTFDECNLIADWYSRGVYMSSALPGKETPDDTMFGTIFR